MCWTSEDETKDHTENETHDSDHHMHDHICAPQLQRGHTEVLTGKEASFEGPRVRARRDDHARLEASFEGPRVRARRDDHARLGPRVWTKEASRGRPGPRGSEEHVG